MSTAEATTITQSIEVSIREDRIVHLEARIDTQEWVNLAAALGEACEDYAETQDADSGNEVREYWGTDEDGDSWRIHLTGTP